LTDIKILVVDDEDKMRNVIRLYLEKEGYIVLEAPNGEDALEQFYSSDVSLILLDVMMPKIDGWTVARKIRQDSLVPIIMLSARGEEYDKLFGFELGVDDYITKPFSPKEMVARVKVAIRRGSNNESTQTEVLNVGLIKLMPQSRQITLNGDEINLTPKEYDLLYFLTKNENIVFSRDQLLSKVWGYNFVGDARTVATHIKQLREKLGEYKTYIHTIWGTGYKFKAGQ